MSVNDYMISPPQSAVSAFEMLENVLERNLAVCGQYRPPISHLEHLEERFNVKLPGDYAAFLQRFGFYRSGSVTVFGLTKKPYLLPSIESAIDTARGIWPNFPRDLIPIQALGGGVFYCLKSGLGEGPAYVTRWPFIGEGEEGEPIAPGFSEFLSGRVSETYWFETSWKSFERHVVRFHEDYTFQARLPRSDVWRPYRFCVQDIVIGLSVIRHSLEDNCLLVDSCMVFDPPEFEPYSGSKMMTVALLSEAYKSGGSMELRFSGGVEGGRVPRAIFDLATRTGVRLKHVDEGRVSPSEARRLYLAISDLPATLKERIESLAGEGCLSAERACYAVHHGVWTRPELECIVLGSPDPDGILAGTLVPEDRHIYLRGQRYGRAAILGGWLDRKLAKRERQLESGAAMDLEDDVHPLSIVFNSDVFAKVYRCEGESLTIPWLANPTAWTDVLDGGEALIVLVRARELTQIASHFGDDLRLAVALAEQGPNRHRVALLYPRDFQDMDHDRRESLLQSASREGIGVLVCPETSFSMDADVRQRMHRSRIMRQ